MANGRLTERNGSVGFKDQLFDFHTAKHVAGVDAIAMAFVLHQFWATVVLSVAATPNHLLSDLKALEVCLDADDIQPLQQFSESPSDYWKTRSDLAWN